MSDTIDYLNQRIKALEALVGRLINRERPT